MAYFRALDRAEIGLFFIYQWKEVARVCGTKRCFHGFIHGTGNGCTRPSLLVSLWLCIRSRDGIGGLVPSRPFWREIRCEATSQAVVSVRVISMPFFKYTSHTKHNH